MRVLLSLGLALFSAFALAESSRLAIIIDDVGNDYAAAQQLMELPVAVTLAVLPRLGNSRRIAEEAHQQGREVMLHQPMQSVHHKHLGPGGLTLDHTRADLEAVLAANLASVPHVAGVNNHMGSLLTQDADAMASLMSVLRDHGGLFFVDSRTDGQTLAERMARDHGLRSARRDVFLDNDPDPERIRAQLEQAVQLARERGSAIAIGHPYPQTLAVLREALPQWQALGIELVSASQAIAHQRSPQSWHASLSPSPRVVKNSKP